MEVDDLDTAMQAADELVGVAGQWKTDGLRAAAAHARGAVALAAGDAARAVGPLREAVGRWHELDAPYDGARARLLLADACAELGDREAGRLELDAAAATLERLGAVVDLRQRNRGRTDAHAPGRLTRREVEVLAFVAEGDTNRQVAARLVISDKTVARHLANIYRKLGVSTRTGAAAWARRNDLRPPTA